MPTPLVRSSLRPVLIGVLALVVLGLSAPRSLAGSFVSLPAFQANVRADTLFQSFDGSFSNNLAPISVNSGGYSYVVSTTGAALLVRSSFGVGATFSGDATRFTFSARPVTAFAAQFSIVDTSLTRVAGTITITTDTGASFGLNVSASGTFFGFTTATPFTTVTINADQPGPTRIEQIDDVIVGISASATVPADQCSDAPTISPISAAIFPFTTVGLAAGIIGTSCNEPDTGPDGWIRFLAPVNGTVVFNTCGSTFDTILRVFDSCATTTNIVCNDDFCTGGGGSLASQVQFRCVAGEDYLIRISGFNGQSGSGNLNFSIVPDCRADFDANGQRQPADIFAFLNAYFGPCN